MLELCQNFSTKFRDVNKFIELELDKFAYLVLAKIVVEDCIKTEMRAEWQRLRSNDCVNSFTSDALLSFFPRKCCVKHKQHKKRGPGLFIEEFRCTEMLFLYSEAYCCFGVTSIKPKFSSKDLNKRVPEWRGHGLVEKYRRVLNGKVNVFWNDTRFWTNHHSVATYEQVNKSLSYVYQCQ